MLLKKLYPLLVITVLLGALSCQKTNSLTDDIPGIEDDIPGIEKADHTTSPTSLEIDDALSEAFTESFLEPSGETIANIFSPLYQTTTEYQSLSEASVAILQQAGVLDSLKFYLNTTSNTDPHLILAAKLINDLYVEGPPPPDSIQYANTWKCLLEALGVPAAAVLNIMKGVTMAEIGTIIHAMGFRWLAGTLLKAGLGAATGWGLATMVGIFTWCMVWESSPEIADGPIDWHWPEGTNPPLDPTDPTDPTYTVQQFTDYINAVIAWYPGTGLPAPTVWYPADLISAIDAFNVSAEAPTYLVFALYSQPGFIAQLKNYINTQYVPGLSTIYPFGKELKRLLS